MRACICIVLLLSGCLFAKAQQAKQDTSSAVKAMENQLQGIWSGPDESYYFLFRGDSVKEWEADGADSSVKPFCICILSKLACDSLSAQAKGTTGFFITITCPSTDYNESKCYFIQSISPDDLQLGIKGEFNESGHMKKVKRQDGGH